MTSIVDVEKPSSVKAKEVVGITTIDVKPVVILNKANLGERLTALREKNGEELVQASKDLATFVTRKDHTYVDHTEANLLHPAVSEPLHRTILSILEDKNVSAERKDAVEFVAVAAIVDGVSAVSDHMLDTVLKTPKLYPVEIISKALLAGGEIAKLNIGDKLSEKLMGMDGDSRHKLLIEMTKYSHTGESDFDVRELMRGAPGSNKTASQSHDKPAA